MNKMMKIILFFAALGMLLLISGVIYTVDETNQVIITQFGKPVAEITEAGIHFKKPFIQQARYFEKRILEWDGDANQIPTKDKRYIWIDTTARWKVGNPLKFLESVGGEVLAHARLDDIINSATRDAITNNHLVETVRNSNAIIEDAEVAKNLIMTEEAVESINLGREKLENIIFEKAKKLVTQYGIELIDLRIKRVNYVEQVERKVYDRMIAERQRAAEQYRSEGRGRRAEIEGLMGKELKKISSEAYRTAQKIKGTADAESTKTYAKAYEQDPEFYSFLKTLETYQDTIDENSVILLTTNSEYYKFLKTVGSEK
ncbi:MAG: protease modulator HflC [Candidatus Saelkia tenebricola]|nr:protease modulator HflC [Candidatus Saelkia tenebricola]